jgi:NADH:ubiquinone oxidoreductase subunit 5 (subunit L)/multisubunit Na+/H+ antiporter MnhA subunit
MFDALPPLWLIPALPLVASVLTAFLGPRVLRDQSHWPCIVSLGLSCLLSFLVLGSSLGQTHDGHESAIRYYTWFQAGTVDVGFTLRSDPLTAIMLVTVTFIGSLIAIFSVGYMHGDPGYARFFAEIALFIFSMTGLVLANNFLLLYAFWEGVGLCSYLLIGFWFTKPSAALAARKAFLVTRLGDVGFFLGILWIWATFDYSLDFDTIFAKAELMGPGTLLPICLLLFCGAIGKSAQFPLHVWLPDAMEGPTPVSALIHAATMVTAGVYLVARCTPLYARAPEAQLVVACIGGLTALLAALMALTQNDLKRVLAYSTISQLGYMFLALGSAISLERPPGEGLPWTPASPLVTLGVVAAIFHLFTHAFFKALLFLAAGSVMHAMGNVIDMRRFGGLRYVLRTTHWTFLCGALALAGVPLLSGFWSKDDILAATFQASHIEDRTYAILYTVLFITALITAGLTAYYTFRAYFLTFWGELRIPPEAGDHAHESPPVMTVPLMILAIGAVAIGIAVEPVTHWFSGFLGGTPGLRHVTEHTTNPVIMLGSTLFALAGIGVAAWMYLLRPGVAGQLARLLPGLYQLSLNRFYLDEIYAFFVVQPLVGLAQLARLFDLYVVDGLVDLIGQMPRFLGQVFRPIQNGLAQFYALAMALGLTVFLVALVWRYAW